MQATPDKDFNQAFKKRFESFEVEPSVTVWKAIALDLDKEKKRSFPAWQFIAASVLVILGAGLWLSGPEERIRLHGKANEVVIREETQPEETRIIPEKQAEQVIRYKQSMLPTVVRIKTEQPAVKAPEEAKAQIAEETPKIVALKIPAKDMAIAKHDDQVLKEDKLPASSDKMVMAFANDDVPAEDNAERYVSNTRERNGAGLLGNVVNYVVGKVDPRRDKIIKFTKDEDGGSEISGINLGLVKMVKTDNNR